MKNEAKDKVWQIMKETVKIPHGEEPPKGFLSKERILNRLQGLEGLAGPQRSMDAGWGVLSNPGSK